MVRIRSWQTERKLPSGSCRRKLAGMASLPFSSIRGRNVPVNMHLAYRKLQGIAAAGRSGVVEECHVWCCDVFCVRCCDVVGITTSPHFSPRFATRLATRAVLVNSGNLTGSVWTAKQSDEGHKMLYGRTFVRPHLG